jgi:cytochrome P450
VQRVAQVVVISKAAVDRLSSKLTALKGTGRPVDMAEELRMLTLQVIGEAILSLPPEECDKASTSSCEALIAGQWSH